MRTCCVPSCLRNNRKDQNLSFHEFPCRADMREKWIRLVSRLDPETKELWQPNDKSVVCSRHFNETDFRTGVKHRLLKFDAVPTVFSNYPTYMQRAAQKFVQKRKPPMTRLPLPPKPPKKPRNVLAHNESPTVGVHYESAAGQPSRFKNVAVQVMSIICPVDTGVQVNSMGRPARSTDEARKKLRTAQKAACRTRKLLAQMKERVAFLEKKLSLSSKYPIRKVIKKAKSGSVHAQFLLEQLQIYNKNRQRVNYSTKTLEFCHTWKQYCSSRSYEYVRRIGLLALPSRTTLMRHQIAIDASQEETAKQKKAASDSLVDEIIESVVRSSCEDVTSVTELTNLAEDVTIPITVAEVVYTTANLVEDVAAHSIADTSHDHLGAGGIGNLHEIKPVFHDLASGQVFYMTDVPSDDAENSLEETVICNSENSAQTAITPTILQVFTNDHCYYGTVLPCKNEPISTQLPPNSSLLEQLLTTGASACDEFG